MRLVRHPVLCNYYLTYRCNAKCSFCDIWEKPSPYVIKETVIENLHALKRLGVSVIDFTGGEPLLHRQLAEFLAYAKQLGFLTTVTTNTLLYPKYAEAIQGKIDMLHFSLDSPNEVRHNESRGVNCFAHFIKSLEIAKKLGEKPDILFTVFDDNIHEIEEVYERFAKPDGLILILNPVFQYNHVGENLSSETLAELIRWGKKPNVYLNDAFIALRKAGGNQIDNPVCKAGSTTIVISPENELIVPCYHLGAKRFPIQGNLYELYYSAEVQTWIAQEGKLPGCQGCTINCYMQPSFATQINTYFWKALPSTLKYSVEKWVYKTW
ncbi:MAG: radical SAM protein [Bacteroidia bacterium]|nr:radical SAM protein [Bacteroidia bacterium]